MMASASSSDGTLLNVFADGDPRNPALVFIHGFAQSAAAWQRQADALRNDFYVVRFDLRGHGESGKPDGDAAYVEPQYWANDVRVILDEVARRDPILIGWSYGGRVIADYLQVYGAEKIAGIVLVGAISLLGLPPAETFRNPELRAIWRELLSPDERVARPAFERFTRLCFAVPVPESTIAAMAEASLRLPPHARAAMLMRTAESVPTWSAYKRPALIVHGDDDRIVLPAAADWHAAQLPQAVSKRYPGVGHVPFVEAEERFTADLRAFASTVLGSVSR
jgi:pimeloyl-ACP methyl ester carboxylesterase